MGRLSTHVLDTSAGLPAVGVLVTLQQRHDDHWHEIASARTNRDGRTDKPLLEGDAFEPGEYELHFHVGDYYGAGKTFFTVIPVRFVIADRTAHYHVPLLLAPWSYSTYRGS